MTALQMKIWIKEGSHKETDPRTPCPGPGYYWETLENIWDGNPSGWIKIPSSL